MTSQRKITSARPELGGCFRNFHFRSLDLDSSFWIPGFGFLGLDLGFEFLRLDSLVWISVF